MIKYNKYKSYNKSKIYIGYMHSTLPDPPCGPVFPSEDDSLQRWVADYRFLDGGDFSWAS